MNERKHFYRIGHKSHIAKIPARGGILQSYDMSLVSEDVTHVDCVIFDLDGTLIQTESLVIDAATTIVESYGKTLTNEAITASLGKRPLEAWASVQTLLGIPATPQELFDASEPLLTQRYVSSCWYHHHHHGNDGIYVVHDDVLPGGNAGGTVHPTYQVLFDWSSIYRGTITHWHSQRVHLGTC